MKTFYWSFLLMLLPSMAYTQNTEKENEFTMSMQIRPRAEYRNSGSCRCGATLPPASQARWHGSLPASS